MCFTVMPGREVPKIAKKDIVVFKVVRKSSLLLTGFRSLVINFVYEWGKLYNEPEMVTQVTRKYENLHKGFHSYAGYSVAKQYLRRSWNYIAIRCTIPKGSLYYYNREVRQYLSNNLIIGTVNDVYNDFKAIDVSDLCKYNTDNINL